MPNNKKFVVKNGLQTQNVDFVSNNESNTVSISVSDTGILSIDGKVKFSNSIYDSNNSTGTSGQILSSTENGVEWIAAGDVQGTSGFSGYSGISGYSGFSGMSAPAIVFDGGSPFNVYSAGPVFDAGGVW